MTSTAGTSLFDASQGEALLINGKRASETLLAEIREKSGNYSDRVQPGLAVILVGSDPASQVYVKSKGKAAISCGFYSEQHDLPENTSEAELIVLIKKLNADPRIHGILLQLPLPKGADARHAIEAIAPEKDVDGLHPVNSGLLALGDLSRALLPCTPAGCLYLLDQTAAAFGQPMAGAEALVIGRSNLVGKPIAQLLLARNATVTLAHSKTQDLEGHIGRADILIAAIGRPEAIAGSLVKKGAIVIDVGINRVPASATPAENEQKTKLVGDVSFLPALAKARAITPVPGGVGPMTIAMLMANTLQAALRISNIKDKVLSS